MDSQLIQYSEPTHNLSVIIEDDGRVAYAYLRQGTKIVGDVWLYNVLTAPEAVDWNDRGQMPFLNPGKYARDEPPIRIDSRLRIAWTVSGASLYSGDVLLARLEINRRPGWSRQARIPGPLALPLEST